MIQGDSLNFTLRWTNFHRISFIGLVRGKYLNKDLLDVHPLVSLTHSKKDYSKEDIEEGNAISLSPGQYINLSFKASPKKNISRRYLFYSKGYYKKL
jgi:hypothetical protein